MRFAKKSCESIFPDCAVGLYLTEKFCPVGLLSFILRGKLFGCASQNKSCENIFPDCTVGLYLTEKFCPVGLLSLVFQGKIFRGLRRINPVKIFFPIARRVFILQKPERRLLRAVGITGRRLRPVGAGRRFRRRSPPCRKRRCPPQSNRRRRRLRWRSSCG